MDSDLTPCCSTQCCLSYIPSSYPTGEFYTFWCFSVQVGKHQVTIKMTLYGGLWHRGRQNTLNTSHHLSIEILQIDYDDSRSTPVRWFKTMATSAVYITTIFPAASMESTNINVRYPSTLTFFSFRSLWLNTFLIPLKPNVYNHV